MTNEETRPIEEDVKRGGHPKNGRAQLARETVVRRPGYGRYSVCGCKVAKTETICGECMCEEDGID